MDAFTSVVVMGLMMGLFSSAHCVGMCGPLVLALPLHPSNPYRQAFQLLLYALGRISAYLILGILFGLLGQQIQMAGWQQSLSIGLGILMIATVLLPQWKGFQTISLNPLFRPLHTALTRQFKKGRAGNLAFIGFLNGFLPCGMVYMAIAGALVLGDLTQAGLFMAGFGLGTVPALFALAWMANSVSFKWRASLQRVLPVFTLVLGLLFILRGLGLGIPLLSPPTEALQLAGQESTVSCH
jgi:hypothetical protein